MKTTLVSTSPEVDRALDIMNASGRLGIFYRLHTMNQTSWLRNRHVGRVFKLELNQMVRDALRSER